jgi:hypothetical protein
MKKIFTFSAFFILFQFAKGQNPVPNPSFEVWVDANTPTSWTSSAGGTITKVAGLNGSWAAKGSVMTGSPNPYVPTLASINAGNAFPITQFYTYLQFWYKTNLVTGGGGQDKVDIEVNYFDNSNVAAGYDIAPQKYITATASNWTFKQIQIYPQSGTAQKAIISFTIQPGSGTYPNVGSYFIVDSVKLSNTAIGINEIEETSKLEIYPNPAHDNLKIKTEATKSMQITISDALGNIVIRRMSSEPISGYIQESINIESLSSGVYFLTLTSDKKSILRRVLVN